MPLSPETPPSVKPGTKFSLPDQGNTGVPAAKQVAPKAPTDVHRTEATGDKTTTPEHQLGQSLADGIRSYFKLPAATDRRVGPNGKPLMEAVDEAVEGAHGANPDY